MHQRKLYDDVSKSQWLQKKKTLCLVGLLNRVNKITQLQNTVLSGFKVKIANTEEELRT